jgi:hypothetical protein
MTMHIRMGRPSPRKGRWLGLAFTLSFVFGTALLLQPRAAHALGEQNGRIKGTITEAQTQAPVPGATVTVRSGSLIGGPRTVTSGDDGSYEFVELPPGKYDVEVSYSGVKPIKRRVVIRQGETMPLDIAWSAELAQAEVTVVVEERHMTKPDSTQSGTVLSADTQGRIASQRDYQDIASQVAGVANGANNDGNPIIHGAQELHNRYLVDGLDITDPVTNTFSANINFDSIGSEEILTGGMEAQYNSLGGVINLITNAGSDEFHIDSSFYVNNAKFTAGSQAGPQLYNGIREWSGIAAPPSQKYQANINVGGPILKHRLWYNISLEYDYVESSTPAGPPLNLQHPSETFQSVFWRAKLTWAPSEKHRISLSASGDPAFIANYRQDNYRLGTAEDHQNQGGVFAIAQWDYFKSQNLNTQVSLGFQYGGIEGGPQGYFGAVSNPTNTFSAAANTYNLTTPQHVNNDDGTYWYNGGGISISKRYTVQFDPSLSVRGKWLGSHDAKFGIQSRYARYDSSYRVSGVDPQGNEGASYSDLGGGPLESGICNEMTGNGCYQKTLQPAYSQTQQGVSVGAFVQDRWKPWKRLTILPGIRFDYGYTQNSLGQMVSNMFGVGPRLGFTLDLTGDQKTIFTAYYGRANEVMSLLAAANADFTPTSTTFQWNQATKTFDKLYTTGGSDGYRLNPTTTPPHADEVQLDLRREVFHDSVAAISYTYKKYSNIWDKVEINQIWNPPGTNVVGYVDGKAHQVFLYTTPDGNYRTYQGIDFTFESRPTPNLDIYAAYTLSWLYGPGNEQLGQIYNGGGARSPFYNPRTTQFFDGFLLDDVRHQLKIHGSYVWHGLNLGVNFAYNTGSPVSKRFYNRLDGDYTLLRAPQGTDPGTGNDAKNISEFRLPDLLQVDARIAYDFHELIKGQHHLTLIADLFNLFNLNGVTSISTRDVPTFAQVVNRQTPFKFQLGLRYQY